jgi:hypothetical protein
LTTILTRQLLFPPKKCAKGKHKHLSQNYSSILPQSELKGKFSVHF